MEAKEPLMKILSLTEVMEILQVSRRTLYHYIEEGQLEAFKVGKGWRVTEKALKAFIDERIKQAK